MILRNQQVGNNKDVTVISLGQGTIGISAIWQEGERAGITFVTVPKEDIGTEQDNDGSMEVLLSFENIESYNVFYEYLLKVRDKIPGFNQEDFICGECGMEQ